MRANETLLISDLKHSLYKNHDAEKLFLTGINCVFLDCHWSLGLFLNL